MDQTPATNSTIDPAMDYLASSVQLELSRHLSPSAGVFLPGTKEFDMSNLRFTQYKRPTYIAAVWPAKEHDVAATVKYAHMRGIPCAARGGGHCVTSTMDALSNGLCIDMRLLTDMSFDAVNEHVIIGGGVQSGPFTRFLHNNGRELTVGSCPTTGLMGVCLGGGIGRLQGKYGLLSDNLVSCRIVLADGSVVVASENERPDLFWALRGAGHNFGIVVEATFRVYPQAHGGLHHSWDFEFSLDQCGDVFQLVNTLAHDMDPNLAVFALYTRTAASGAKDVVLINIVWSGPKGDAEPYISRFNALSPIVHPTQVTAEWPDLPWITYQGLNARSLGNTEAWRLVPYNLFSAASVRHLDVNTMHDFFQSIKSQHDDGLFVAITMIEVFSHRRVREPADDATAFPWRKGNDIFVMYGTAATTAAHTDKACEWIQEWNDKLVRTSGYENRRQYVNYGNGADVQDPVESLYGHDLWRLEKLRRLKDEYDPENYWRFYQPLVKQEERASGQK